MGTVSMVNISSCSEPAINMVCYYKKGQCPKGHSNNKSVINKVGKMTHWQCLCGRKWWSDEFKHPKSVSH